VYEDLASNAAKMQVKS